MKKLLRILLGIVLFFGVLLLAGYLLPREVTVSRSAVIPAPQWQVYDPVADLTQWDQWAKWNRIDPAMKIDWGVIRKGDGASYAWESDNPQVGKGAMRIVGVQGMDRLELEIDFDGMGTSTSAFDLVQTNDGTGITWSITTDMGAGPIGRWFGLFMDGMVGPDFEEGLANLSEYVATQPSAMEIKAVEVPAKHVLFVQTTSDPDKISSTLAECYGKVVAYMAESGVEQAGAPFAAYDYSSEGDVAIMAGIPIGEAIEGSSTVLYQRFEPVKALQANYFGGYSGVGDAYKTLTNEADKMGADLLSTEGAIGWEEYITDPIAQPDTSQWLTEVYIPIRSRSTLEAEELAN